MTVTIGRRELLAALGGAAAWPLAARAQERVRHIGMISGISDEAAMRERLSVFLQKLQRLGWVEGRNVQIEYRWGKGYAEPLRRDAMELAALAPDVIVATGGATMTYMLQATRTVPIVFVIVPDPVGSGFVKSLSRPGGNATGFMQFEYSLSGKWALLKRCPLWSCLNRLRPPLRERRFYGIPLPPPELVNSPSSSPWPHRSGLTYFRSRRSTPAISSATSRNSRRLQTAA